MGMYPSELVVNLVSNRVSFGETVWTQNVRAISGEEKSGVDVFRKSKFELVI